MEKEKCPRCGKKVKYLKQHIANIHQGEDMLKAFKELEAKFDALKTSPPPPPPSYAAVAALPPPPPPPSPPTSYTVGPKILLPSERIFNEPKPLNELLEILMRKSTDNNAWLPLRLAYSSHPEDFTIIGDKHTDADGNNLHLSVEWKTGLNKEGRQTYRTIHIYGYEQYGKFIGTHVSLRAYKDVTIELGKFIYRYKTGTKFQDNDSTGTD